MLMTPCARGLTGAGVARIRLIAVAIALAESAQVMYAGRDTLSIRAPGQTPRTPIPLAGAAATAAVAVPWKSVSGWVLVELKLGSPVHSGCVMSACSSTTAMSGLEGVTAGGSIAGFATSARHALGGADSGSSATASACAYEFGCAYMSRRRDRSAAASARARVRPTT